MIPSSKILIDKLGVKPNSKVSVLGIQDKDFWEQLEGRTSDVSNGSIKKDSDYIFFLAKQKEDLRRLKNLQESIKMNGSIWVVTPRGRLQIKQTDVIVAAKEIGLVDTKVVRFSETHTALRLVIPLSRRSNLPES